MGNALPDIKNFKKQQKRREEAGEILQGHEDAVLCLSVNPFQQEYLASGSADQTVKIWDITERTCKQTYSLHTEKVQIALWNQKNEQLLLTGGFDHRLFCFDVRKGSDSALKFKVKGDIESCVWHPTSEHHFVTSLEDGSVLGYDLRKDSKPIFSVQAHQKACTSVTISLGIPNLLATASQDGSVKLWDLKNGEPKLISMKDMKVGELFTCQFYQDNPWVIACGGAKGEIGIWDTEEDKLIKNHFSPYLVPGSNLFADGVEEVSDFSEAEEMESEDEEEVEKPKKKKK